MYQYYDLIKTVSTMGILALKGDLNLSQISVSQFMNGPFGKLQAKEKNPTLCLSIKVSGDVY